MISNKYKFVFIHIPKTGGTSIEKVFIDSAQESDIPLKHATMQELLEKNKVPENYFAFTFVRNPWDLTVSMYNFMWKSDYDWPVRWRQQNEDFAKLSFEEWVLHPFFKSPTIRSTNITIDGGRNGKYKDWYFHKDKKIDFIGKYESLQNDFDYVCDIIEHPRQKLEVTNKSKGKKHYTDYYTVQSMEIVKKKYKEEIDLFKYSFGDDL